MRNNIFLLLFLSVQGLPACAIGLGLPIGFSQVDQTYGDFSGGPVYHDGIDLPGVSSQTVYSPVYGHVSYVEDSPWKPDYAKYICITTTDTQKTWAFGHLIPASGLVNGSTVPVGEILGTLVYNSFYTHMHVGITPYADTYLCGKGIEEDPLRHFLAVTQVLTLEETDIIPVPDKFRTTVVSELDTRFPPVPVGTETFKGVYGDIDLIVHARNNVNNGNRSGVHRIDYGIEYYHGGMAVQWRTPFVMKDLMYRGREDLSVLETYLSPPTNDNGTDLDWDNYYTITNSSGTFGESVHMYSNIEEASWRTSDYPDTTYKVRVKTYDYPTIDNGYISSTKEASRGVVLDNYRPHAQEVELLLKSGETEISKYHVKWATNAVTGSTDTLVPGVLTDQPLVPGEYKAVITFSEYMSAPGAGLAGGPAIIGELHEDPSVHKTRLEGNLSLQLQDYPQDAQVQLLINGADKANNGLLGLTSSSTTISITSELRRAANGFLPGTPGTDSFHTLRIEATQPMITRENSSGILDNACMGVCST